jgi:parvulin-like peptidyl-prolyl isomerase
VATANGLAVSEREWATTLVYTRGPEELLAMVDEALIRQEASAKGLKATPEEVRAKVTEIASYVGSRRALEDRVKALGMGLDDLNRRAETQALLDDLARADVRLDDGELRRYYTQHVKEFTHGPAVKARMMLYSQKANADAVMTMLKAGGDFAGLAKSVSEDPATAADGGDMGWVEARDYAPEITRVVFAAPSGGLSSVFQGPDGWYIIRVEGRRPGGVDAFERVRETIRTRMVQERMVEERAVWLKARRQQAKIEVEDPRLAASVRQLLATAPPPGLLTPDQLMGPALSQPSGR